MTGSADPAASARPPILAVSLGDPAGVGPELIARAWQEREAHSLPPFVVAGSAALLREAAARVGIALPVRRIASVADGAPLFADALPVIDLGDLEYSPGRPSRDGARLALASLERAAALVLSGAAAALVTAPIAKSALADIGFAVPGQTEFVAAACGVDAADAVMMLAGPSLRVVPITVHERLADVPGLLSEGLIRRRVAIAVAALQGDFGIAAPRIAVAGLNPHAGENGRLGDEEQRIIAPAIAALRADGVDVTGPLPADGMFHAAARAQYDLAICMYHDQALVPLKALHFASGVNVTLGLPIVRTSPDHGTAFAIAGSGTADPGPTIAALRMADECAMRRRAAAARG